MKIRIKSTLLATLALFLTASSVSAHVSVGPEDVSVGAFETFTVGVPNERETETTSVRLDIPDGLGHVMPLVKPGWDVEVTRSESSENADENEEETHVTELIWSGGTVPVGMKDTFSFSAQAPTDETTLSWNAYQTYADGTVISWDVGENEEQPTDEEGNPDFSERGPASRTEVIDDLANQPGAGDAQPFDAAYLLSIIALGLSGVAVYLSTSRKK